MALGNLGTQAEGIDEEQLNAIFDFINEVHITLTTDYSQSAENSDGILRIDRESAPRTSARVLPEHKQLAEKYSRFPQTRNRELFYAFCIEFARVHEDRFQQFLANYAESEVKGTLGNTLELPDPTVDVDAEQDESGDVTDDLEPAPAQSPPEEEWDEHPM